MLAYVNNDTGVCNIATEGSDYWAPNTMLDQIILHALEDFRARVHSYPLDLSLEQWKGILEHICFWLDKSIKEEMCTLPEAEQASWGEDEEIEVEQMRYMLFLWWGHFWD